MEHVRIMADLKVSVLVLVLVAKCWTAPLEVLVDGVEFTGTEFCVGDNVTFICSQPFATHQWFGPEFSRILNRVSPTNMVGPGNNYTLALVQPLPNTTIITSLSLIAYSGFDGVTLTCSDGIGQVADTQTSTASVLGPPLAPTISLIARAGFKSFNVTLSTNGPSARCVLQYCLTVIENGEPLTALAIIGSNGTGSVGGLNLCKNMYTFTSVAMTKDMNSSSSGPVAGLVDFSAVSELSGVRVDNGVVHWTISSSLPGECFGSYSLRQYRCMIQNFAVLPALDLSEDAVRAIFAGISAATPPTSMTAVYSASYENVDIDNCVRPTLRTFITPANISGHLVLSSASTEASTSLCNISLSSGGVASTSSLVTSCSATASKPEVKGQRSLHESPAIQLKNPARSPRDSTNQPPLYEECISAYENTDVIVQQKAPEATNVGPSVGDYVFSQCNAYGVHKNPGKMMEDGCYAQVETPGGGH